MSKDDVELQRARSCHQDLKFWVWAALHSADEYTLVTTERTLAVMMADGGPFDVVGLSHLRNRQRLAEHNLRVSIDSLTRALKRARQAFPELRAISIQAKHLIEEGKSLRHLCESANARYKKLVPEHGPTVGRRRSKRAPEDTQGHGVVDRLNIERLVANVRAIEDFTHGIAYPYPE